jgi:glutamate racemase
MVDLQSPSQCSDPVGVFDSGIGGLSVFDAISHRLPNESLVFVADSGYAPYGDRSSQFVIERVFAVAQFLIDARAKALVIACNTASVVAVRQLRERFSIPIIAMEPAIKPAVALSKSRVVAVLATSRTIASDSTMKLCETFGNECKILLQACPGLVEQVEKCDFDSLVTLALLHRYLDPLLAQGADTFVLGCTHYPFLITQIRHIVGDEACIVEPSAAVAEQLRRRLGANLNADASNRQQTFYTTGDLPSFQQALRTLMPDVKERPYCCALVSKSPASWRSCS